MTERWDVDRNELVSQLLQTIVDKEHLSWPELGKRTGVEYSVFRYLMTGKRGIGAYSLRKVADAFPQYRREVHALLTASDYEIQHMTLDL
jgi:predicted transcriptional regulator